MQAERAQQEARNGARVVPFFAELVRTGAVAEAQRRLERIPVELAEQLRPLLRVDLTWGPRNPAMYGRPGKTVF